MTDGAQLLFLVDGANASSAEPITLSEAGIRERQHLQEWVIAHPEILGEDVLIITSEFDRWSSESGESARERLDVLGLDPSGRLVVVELKRDSDRLIHIQATTYAALVSGFDEETLAAVYAEFLSRRGDACTPAEALERINDHVEDGLDSDVLSVPRIILLAGQHPAQVITTADWLTRQGLDIELREVRAFRLGAQLAVSFDQLYPVPGIGSQLLAPARRQAVESVERAAERAKRANAVGVIIENDLLPPGAPLALNITTAVNPEIRATVRNWVSESPDRALATWTNERSAPLRWKPDGTTWTPTGLARHVLKEATGIDRPLKGTSWWVTADGEDLSSIAGISSSTARDWSDLHELIAVIAPGEWTSYGELASAIGLPAQPVGTHISRCQLCPPGAHRVLTRTGKPAIGFHWSDPNDERTCEDVLASEGIAFDASGNATLDGFVDGPTLARRRTETG